MPKFSESPRIARLILERLIDNDLRFGALGDLEEQYAWLKKQKGPLYAALHYWLQIAAALPAFLRNSITWSFVMIKNSLKGFFRNIKKHKGYSFLNFSGLTLGLSVFILIMLFVHHEMGYDKFNEKIDRIYRVQGAGGRQAWMAPGVGKWIKERIPEVENVARLADGYGPFVTYIPEGNPEALKQIQIKRSWADSTTFNVFSFSFLQGDPSTALINPYTVVFTESTARNLFGDRNPIGEIVETNNHQYEVTGVIHDIENFHVDIDALFSQETCSRITHRIIFNGPKSREAMNKG